ncbi:hypothetical protein O181_033507 [Austropuccinia psidii MF-1]|uniref:Uncharacterized protein n=1 Tax=Austropuccinia psidii MF-1 TaxID=1389203 RepID=A0A9Q3D1I7_9BASI|nr:hypothetical protein [Austropuccinia psidii MF-1]
MSPSPARSNPHSKNLALLMNPPLIILTITTSSSHQRYIHSTTPKLTLFLSTTSLQLCTHTPFTILAQLLVKSWCAEKKVSGDFTKTHPTFLGPTGRGRTIDLAWTNHITKPQQLSSQVQCNKYSSHHQPIITNNIPNHTEKNLQMHLKNVDHPRYVKSLQAYLQPYPTLPLENDNYGLLVRKEVLVWQDIDLSLKY